MSPEGVLAMHICCDGGKGVSGVLRSPGRMLESQAFALRKRRVINHIMTLESHVGELNGWGQ